MLALAAIGCGGGRDDKAGGENARTAATVLELANGDTRGRDTAAFVRAVQRLSHGSLVIQERPNAHKGDVEYEREIVRDVRSGRVAMGKVGARAWDLVGVDDFRPLVAPFAITSLGQQARVLRSATARAMLGGVGALGLQGIALLPGELRYPVGVTRDALRPGDFRGALVGIRPSGMATSTFAALGARSQPIVAGGTYDGVDLAEQDPETLSGAKGLDKARSLTANLPLWPRAQTIVMNAAAYRRLTAEQKRILTAAAAAAIAPTRRSAANSTTAGTAALCTHDRFALLNAQPADVAAMRRAVAPVLAALRRNHHAAAALRTIQRFRGAPDTVRCPLTQQRLPTEHIRTTIDGTWAANVTRRAYFAARPLADEDNEANWGPLRMTVKRGRFAIENARFPGDVTRGSFIVRGNLVLMAPEGTSSQGAGEIWRYRWSLYRGMLRLQRAASTSMPTALRAVPWTRIR